MSDLVAAQNELDLLKKYAEEFGLEMEPDTPKQYKKKVYTQFLDFSPEDLPDGVELRKIKPAWSDTGTFAWELEGLDEDLDNFSGVNQLGGYVLFGEIQADRTVFDAENNTFDRDRSCSSVGYYSQIHQGLIKGLPETAVLKRMNPWDDKKKEYVSTVPEQVIKDIQLVGSRGMTCENCIMAGLSQVETPAGVKRCTPRGRIFFYLTHVSRIKKQRPAPGQEPELITTTKTIEELYGKPGLLMMLNLPNKGGLNGEWHTEFADSVLGYASYMSYLKVQARTENNVYLKNPYFHFTTITIKAPTKGASKKNLLHFERHPLGDSKLYEAGRQLWKSIYQRPVEYLNPADFQDTVVLKGEVPVNQEPEAVIPVAATPSKVTPMKSAAPPIMEDEIDDIPF